MIWRLARIEFATLRRSFVVWLALLLVVGGSVVARMLTWVGRAVGRSELGAFLFINPSVGWGHVAVPLVLLAGLIVTSYAFGRDFEDGNIDLVLTAPVPRDAVVLARTLVISAGLLALWVVGWTADIATHAVLATSTIDPGAATSAAEILGAAVAGIATLPLVAWASVRFRGVLPALGLGIAIEVVVLALGGLAPVRLLPWFLPVTLADGGSASWLSIALSLLLFAVGLAATIRELRIIDLLE